MTDCTLGELLKKQWSTFQSMTTILVDNKEILKTYPNLLPQIELKSEEKDDEVAILDRLEKHKDMKAVDFSPFLRLTYSKVKKKYTLKYCHGVFVKAKGGSHVCAVLQLMRAIIHPKEMKPPLEGLYLAMEQMKEAGLKSDKYTKGVDVSKYITDQTNKTVAKLLQENVSPSNEVVYLVCNNSTRDNKIGS